MSKQIWWSKKWGKDKLCGITYTRIRPGFNKYGMTYSVTLNCGHFFYRSALLAWAEKCADNNITCPICRANFDRIDCLLNKYNY